ncbi:MAG: hypothetical protein ACP5G2_07585 [Candidatus Bipolaricaulaceae bacterium]
MAARRGGPWWVVGGLALGVGIAFVIGVLVFWAWPTYQRLRSPLGEERAGAVILRFLKDSPVAELAPQLAEELSEEWARLVGLLEIPPAALPERVYVYAYAEAEELARGFSARTEEGVTARAVVDLMADQPTAGALARLACSLAYGGPGNPAFPRGLACYLDEPKANWAAEAAAYGQAGSWELLFDHAARLLPRDPWEQLFFEVDAPWVSATPPLETVRWLLEATASPTRRARRWEVTAAAFAEFVVEAQGAEGVRAFWLAADWERGARALGLTPAEFADQWQSALSQGARLAADDPVFVAKRALFSGLPGQALEYLRGTAGAEAAAWRGLAQLALGEPRIAASELAAASDPVLAAAAVELADTAVFASGRLRLVTAAPGPWEDQVAQAAAALERAAGFWSLGAEGLPDRVVIYLTAQPRPVDLPWGVVWGDFAAHRLPEVAARFVLELVSPVGLPPFEAVVEGMALHFAYPERDFRGEAAALVGAGRWVPITQPLFAAYPRQLAEAEAGAFVRFLLEVHGESALRAFWAACARGASPFAASLEVLGTDLATLECGLQDWITRP